jgi:hypothetical protein
MQKTLDKGRKHVLDYMKLILDLVHLLEAIHNIWMSAVEFFLFSGRSEEEHSCELKSPQ